MTAALKKSPDKGFFCWLNFLLFFQRRIHAIDAYKKLRKERSASHLAQPEG